MAVTKDDNKPKPDVFKVYDFTKSRTDIVDQRSESNSTNSKSRKWTKKVLFLLLDIAPVNAQTIWLLNNGKQHRKVDSFEFRWNLGFSLVKPWINLRTARAGVPQNLNGIEKENS